LVAKSLKATLPPSKGFRGGGIKTMSRLSNGQKSQGRDLDDEEGERRKISKRVVGNIKAKHPQGRRTELDGENGRKNMKS